VNLGLPSLLPKISCGCKCIFTRKASTFHSPVVQLIWTIATMCHKKGGFWVGAKTERTECHGVFVDSCRRRKTQWGKCAASVGAVCGVALAGIGGLVLQVHDGFKRATLSQGMVDP